MSVAILFDYTAMDDFRDSVNQFCQSHPEKSGHIRDCILKSLMPAIVTVQSDNWPDVRVIVSPADDLLAAIRRKVGPDIVPWLPPLSDSGR